MSLDDGPCMSLYAMQLGVAEGRTAVRKGSEVADVSERERQGGAGGEEEKGERSE